MCPQREKNYRVHGAVKVQTLLHLKDIAAASPVEVIVRKEQKPLVMCVEFQAAGDLDVE